MNIERQVEETIEKYSLMKKSDKVVVALSGGKDSTSVLYILKKLGYDVHGLMIHLCMGGWSDSHRVNMTAFCKELDVSLTIVDFREEVGHGICFMKTVLKEKKNLSGSTVCGIMKRWILNKWAKKLGGDVIVTGHNLDDEAENVLMNYLKGNILLGVNSSPSTGERAVKGFAQRIKPLFFVAENDVLDYAKSKKFDILYDGCPCSAGTYRAETRDWLDNVSDEDKMRIVEGFQKEVPRLRKNNVVELMVCLECGEPSKSDVCSHCELVCNI